MKFRQIHLDFHTSPDIPGIGVAFDPEQFADTLEKAHVNSVTCFARCHHGMLYYDSKLFPERVHPHLADKGLLRRQIDACRRHGIRTPIYITVQWDAFTAKEHPEWLSRNEAGAVNGVPGDIQRPYEAGFYHSLCLNTGYRDFLKAHVREVMELFAPVEGIFFDILYPYPCSCGACTRDMKKAGLSPHIVSDREAFAERMINDFKKEMTGFVRQIEADCSVFYNRGHVGFAQKAAGDAYTHFELESLPGGLWGYMNFPVAMRYARTLGKQCVGMTGKFHTSWGDFHSFKNLAALQYECFLMLALNAACSIGDQLDPEGKLSPTAYELIGAVYKDVEDKEPWCENARALTDIGVFNPEEFIKMGCVLQLSDEIQGATRMLQELGHQFDIIDTASDLSKYKVLVLPDSIPVDHAFAQKLSRYVQAGGAVLASFESGLNAQKDAVGFSQIGISLLQNPATDLHGKLVRGKSFERADYAEYILPADGLQAGLPQTELIMYMKGVEAQADTGAEVLAHVAASYFDRTYEHYCSHRSTPCANRITAPAVVKNGNVIYFTHPVFKQYNINAPLWVKRLVGSALGMLLPSPVLRHDAPSSLIATLNEQSSKGRYVIHLLHYIPERRSLELDIIEDSIPLYDITLSLSLPRAVKTAYLAPQYKELHMKMTDGRVSICVPKIEGHTMVCLDWE